MMKKIIVMLITVLMIVGCFGGCSVVQNHDVVNSDQKQMTGAFKGEYKLEDEAKKDVPEYPTSKTAVEPAFEVPDFMKFENCQMTEEKKAEQQKASDELAARMKIAAEELEAEKKAAEEAAKKEAQASSGSSGGNQNVQPQNNQNITQPEQKPQTDPQPQEQEPEESRVIHHNLCHGCMKEFEGEVCPYHGYCPECGCPYSYEWSECRACGHKF